MAAPDVQPLDLSHMLAVAALNPAMIAVAAWMGSKADQPQKLVLAAFAAAVAGIGLVWLASGLGIGFIVELDRGFVGLFVLQLLFGMVWAAVGYFGLPRPG